VTKDAALVSARVIEQWKLDVDDAYAGAIYRLP
jgi:hypothetical protein